MKKKLYSIMVIAIALLLVLGTGLQGVGFAEETAGDENPDGSSVPNNEGIEDNEGDPGNPLLPQPRLTLRVETDRKQYTPGDTVSFKVTVTNRGEVDLENVGVNDILTGLGETLDLAAGAGRLVECTYVIPEDPGEEELTNTFFAAAEYDGAVVSADKTVILSLLTDNEDPPVSDDQDPPDNGEQPGDEGGESIFDDNPDGLEYPLEIPAPDLYYPSLPESLPRGFGALGLLGGPMGLMSGGHSGDYNNIGWDEPGSLLLTKDAEPVDGTTNQWKITLTIEGKDKQVQTTSDIVLVIDRSGSMKGSRITKAKEAAVNFVETFLSNPDNTSTRIAVVSFAGDVTVYNPNNPFCGESEKSNLIAAINALNADGGTFTQAALRQAKILLDTKSTADYKNIVLLSDGEPTYSYAIKNVSSRLNPTYFENVGTRTWYSRDDLPENVFDYTKTAGNGTGITTQAGSTGGFFGLWATKYYYHHGNSAIAESRFIKAAGITIYSIGFEVGTDGKDILTKIATSGRYYAATESNLNEIFQHIAGSIDETSAARNATVTDPINMQWFSIPGIDGSNYKEKIKVSHGEITNYDISTGTITWVIPFVKEGTPVSMWYTVQISENAVGGVLYDTNLATYLDYTNIDNQNARKHFPIPDAGIEATGTITIIKQMTPGGSSTAEKFAIYLEKQGGGKWSMLLASGQSATITGLGTGTYTIREVVPMGYKKDSISPSTVVFTTNNLNEVQEVTVTNAKGKGGWFRDKKEKINTFTVSLGPN